MRLTSLVTTAAFLSTLLFPPSLLAYVHTASQSFGYDALDRLTSASGGYGSSTYAYDSLGNMLLKEGVTMTYGEGAAGPHAVTSTQSPSHPVADLGL